MIDFISNYSLGLTFAFEFLAAAVGVALYKKYKFTEAKYFIIFLVCVLVLDFLSGYTKFVHPDRFLKGLIGTRFQKNHWITNIYWFLGAIIFYVFYYWRILKTEIFRKIVRIIGFIFFVASISYIALNWNAFFSQFFAFIDIFGGLVILMCSMFYFFEILQSDKILKFYKSLNFYISFVIFFWWLVITPLTFYEVYFSSHESESTRDMSYVILRRSILLTANIFMYLTFAFALIWSNPEND